MTTHPPVDKPRYTAPRAEHLAWIHKIASDLLKEWPALGAVRSGEDAFDFGQAVAEANKRTGELCEGIRRHLPKMAKRLPTITREWLSGGRGHFGFHDGDWTDRLPKVVTELQAIVDATVPSKELSDRECEVLQVLYEGKHFTRDTRTDTATVAKRIGKPGKGASYKDVVAGLKRRGLVGTGRGPGGGVWLTKAGKDKCVRLFPSQKV